MRCPSSNAFFDWSSVRRVAELRNDASLSYNTNSPSYRHFVLHTTIKATSFRVFSPKSFLPPLFQSSVLFLVSVLSTQLNAMPAIADATSEHVTSEDSPLVNVSVFVGGAPDISDEFAALDVPSLLSQEQAHGAGSLSSHDADTSRCLRRCPRPVPSTPIFQTSSPRPPPSAPRQRIDSRIACRSPYHSEFLSELEETFTDGDNTRGSDSIDVAAGLPYDVSVKSLHPRPDGAPTEECATSCELCSELAIDELAKDAAEAPFPSVDVFDDRLIITKVHRTASGRWLGGVVSVMTFADVVREARRSENAAPPRRVFPSFRTGCQPSASRRYGTEIDPIDNGRRYTCPCLLCLHKRLPQSVRITLRCMLRGFRQNMSPVWRSGKNA